MLHHTATDQNASSEDVLQSMIRRYGEPVPTHYIIDKDWTVLNPVPITQPAGWFSTKNWGLTLDEAITLNWQSIHIEVVWTWTDTENPASLPKAQLDAMKNLVNELKSKYQNAEVTAHSLIDKNKWTCWQALLKTYNSESNYNSNKSSDSKWITFSLSRYYSVMPNQKRYYNNRSYEEDFKMNCSWDPLVTANWHQLTDADKYKSVACPKEYPLWTKFYLEWIWEVTCNDRGSAIKTKNWEVRVDMRCWIADDALDNWSKCPTGKRRWYVIK